MNRGTETEEQIQKRLRNAKGELEQGKLPGLFDHILVNDDLEACYQTLKVVNANQKTFLLSLNILLMKMLMFYLVYRISWAYMNLLTIQTDLVKYPFKVP